MSRPIDWGRAGVRLRHSPREHGRNPDWNDRLGRWKTAEEYAGESVTVDEVFHTVGCPVCKVGRFTRCRDAKGDFMDSPHAERRFAKGAAMIAAGWQL